jgi:hypothetical protein
MIGSEDDIGLKKGEVGGGGVGCLVRAHSEELQGGLSERLSSVVWGSSGGKRSSEGVKCWTLPCKTYIQSHSIAKVSGQCGSDCGKLGWFSARLGWIGTGWSSTPITRGACRCLLIDPAMRAIEHELIHQPPGGRRADDD